MSNNESSSRPDHDHDRHQQSARNALRNIIEFHEALAKEMETMTTAAAQGDTIDTELLAKMRHMDKLYYDFMNILSEESEDESQDALVMYTESILDMQRFIDKKHNKAENTNQAPEQ